MRRLIFAPEHALFRDTATRFMREAIGPHAQRWRTAGIVDRNAYLKAGEAGLLCIWADERHGGAAIRDLRFDQIVIEENVRYGETGFYLHLHSNLVAPYVDDLGSPALRDRLMPDIVAGRCILALAMTEPAAGSDLKGLRTMARRDGAGWTISGAKTYISNAILADAVVVVARTDARKPGDVGLFLVERGMPGFERGPRLAKMGLSAQDTAELFFDDVHVPADNVLGDPAGGAGLLRRFLATERLIAAIASIAAASVSLDLTIDFVRQRTAFGRAIASFQNTRFGLAAIKARIDMAQTFVDQLVLQANEGVLTGEDAAAAKLLTSEIEGDMADLGVQLHGGAGYMEEYRICRLYTDARISRIFAGTNEVMKEIIGKTLLPNAV